MSVTRPVYLDFHATTPVDPRVLQAMLPYFSEVFGNASSRQHRFGWQADEAVESARHQVAALIGAKAKEIVFTSGATEANNLAIRGAVVGASRPRPSRGYRRHRASRGARHLQGARTRRLPGDGAAGRARWTGRSRAVCRGTDRRDGAGVGDDRQQRDRRAAAARRAVARLPGAWRVAPHRRGAGRGAGAIRRRRRRRRPGVADAPTRCTAPRASGRSTCDGRRRWTSTPCSPAAARSVGSAPGTLNVPGIVGFGAAAALCARCRPRAARRGAARPSAGGAAHGLDAVTVNGSMSARLPHNLHVSFAGVDGEALMAAWPTTSRCRRGRRARRAAANRRTW